MNLTSVLDLSPFILDLIQDRTLKASTIGQIGQTSLFNATIATSTSTTTSTTISTTTATTTFTTSTISSTTTSHDLLRLFDATRFFPLSPRPTTVPSSLLLKKYFLFKHPFHRIMRLIELFILSLTLPLYAIVLILFIELTVQRISTNSNISGGGTRTRTQRRRQRMRSLIWTSNYLLVDFLSLLYELVYVIIHLTGDLALQSWGGHIYCQVQVYVPLYLTALMAYSLTAISIYRRRHFVNLNNQTSRSTKRSFLLILALWIMPIITAVLPAVLLTHYKILSITQHESTNECQISYTYGSTLVAIYMCYRIGNIFLLPLSISFACYLTICIDLIRMQRRFTRAFKRHVHIRKNLILQILFLFLNFAVFWIPAEIITVYMKIQLLKDTVQVTKCLNIFFDPLIITGFDTRFSTAAHQLLSKWRLDEFMSFLNPNRTANSSSASIQLVTTRSGTTIQRLKRSTIRRTSKKAPTPPGLSAVKWNIADDDDITILEATNNHLQSNTTSRPEIRSLPSVKITLKQGQKQQRRRPSATNTTEEIRSKKRLIKSKPAVNHQPTNQS